MSVFRRSRDGVMKIVDACGRLGRRSGRDLDKPIDSARFVVLDTELTGLDGKKDQIISVGAVRMTGSKIHTGDTLYCMVRPECEMSGTSVMVHGITPSELEERPEIDEVLPKLLSFCEDDVLVGYYPQIDMEFINKESQRLCGVTVDNPVLDIYALYKWVADRMPGEYLPNPTSLYEIAKSFDIPVKGAHNALGDAYITAQVFQRILAILSHAGVERLEELYNLSNPSKVGDALRFYTKTSTM